MDDLDLTKHEAEILNRDDIIRRFDVLRRDADRAQISDLHELEERFRELRESINELDKKIDSKLFMYEHMLEGLLDNAARIAAKQVFAHLGVNVDDPADLQRFRDDLRFGGVFRTAATKSFYALLAAIFGGIGLSLWITFKEKIGL